MNEILAYLERCKDQTYSDRFQHSANYLMSIPLEGHEKEHAAAIRDCEIVEELIAMVKEKEAAAEQPYQNYGVDMGQPGGDNTAIYIQFSSGTDIEKICEAVYKRLDEMTSDSGIAKMQYGCSRQEIATVLRAMKPKQKRPQRVTRRGILHNGSWFAPPEVSILFGCEVEIVDNAIYFDGKEICKIT